MLLAYSLYGGSESLLLYEYLEATFFLSVAQHLGPPLFLACLYSFICPFASFLSIEYFCLLHPRLSFSGDNYILSQFLLF